MIRRDVNAVRVLERVIVALWVGALWSVGYIAAPVLFGTLDDRALAGQLAGNMFTITAYLSVAAGVLLLVIHGVARGTRPRWPAAVVAAMLLLVAIGEFGVRPMMVGAAPSDFGRLHGIAQLFYLAVSLLGLALAAAPCRSARQVES